MNTAATLLCLIPLSVSSALAQHVAATTPSPVANVYVLSTPTSSEAPGTITAFTASSTGQLTPTPIPVVTSTANSIALNGKWLFAEDTANQAILSYKIAASGSLTLADTFAMTNEEPLNVFLDHTGNNLYAGVIQSGQTLGYDTFLINQSTGKLSVVNVLAPLTIDTHTPSFIGNNDFAFESLTDGQGNAGINGFMRQADGSLVSIGETSGSRIPTAAYPNSSYAISGGATDPYNDFVFGIVNSLNNPQDAAKLAVFTADKFGNLTSTSTQANMVQTASFINNVSMSPKGVYLATTGNGLQIFLMHGAKPLTALTGAILPNVSMGRAFWDANQHLYIPAQDSLYVFTVGTSGVKQVPGSPYRVPGASSIIVLPKQ